MIDDVPATLDRLNSPTVGVVSAGILIRAAEDDQRGLAIGQRHPGEVGQPRHRRLYATTFVGHRQHRDPNNARLVVSAPNR